LSPHTGGVNYWPRPLKPLPIFLAISLYAAIGAIAGALVEHWAFGWSLNFSSMLGTSLAVAFGGTMGARRHRGVQHPGTSDNSVTPR
jgi:hypothetical protein